MAAGLYLVKTTVNLTPGAFTLDVAGATTTAWHPGTGSNATGANLYGSGNATPGGASGAGPQANVINQGTLLWVDPASAFGVALGGAGNLSAVTRGQETGGSYGTAN
jgi:hypothetical protein